MAMSAKYLLNKQPFTENCDVSILSGTKYPNKQINMKKLVETTFNRFEIIRSYTWSLEELEVI